MKANLKKKKEEHEHLDEFSPADEGLVSGGGDGDVKRSYSAAPVPLPLPQQPALPPVRINPSLLPVDAYLGVPPKQFVL